MSVQVVLASTEQSETSHVVPYLEQQGWQITRARTGAETLTVVEQVRPLAAIVDVDLPDIAGWDVLQRIRQSSTLRSTVVILVYSEGMTDEDYFRGCRLGADISQIMPVNALEINAFLKRVM